MLELYTTLTTKRLAHQEGAEEFLRADIRCTRLQMMLRIFLFRLEFWCCEDLVAWRTPRFVRIKKRSVSGQVWVPHRSFGRINTSEWRGLSRRIEWDQSPDLEAGKKR